MEEIKICDGSCERHEGKTRKVNVCDQKSKNNWRDFNYCEVAIREDESRGLTVKILE